MREHVGAGDGSGGTDPERSRRQQWVWLERWLARRQYRRLERFERQQVRDLGRERERLEERRRELLGIIENGWLELEDWREFYQQERFREFVLATDELLYGAEKLERESHAREERLRREAGGGIPRPRGESDSAVEPGDLDPTE